MLFPFLLPANLIIKAKIAGKKTISPKVQVTQDITMLNFVEQGVGFI